MAITVKHDGTNITENGPFSVTYSDQDVGGIEAHDRVKEVLKLSPYIKWDSNVSEPVEMTQAEKDAKDAEIAQNELTRIRDVAKDLYNGQQEQGQALRALVKVLVTEINTLRSLHGLTARTLAQAKASIQNEISIGGVDE